MRVCRIILPTRYRCSDQPGVSRPGPGYNTNAVNPYLNDANITLMKSVLMGYRSELFVFVGILLLLTAGCPGISAQEQPGFYEVTSTPAGADVIMNGVFQGETPVLVPVMETAQNGTVLRLVMQGYLPWEKLMEHVPVHGTVVPVRVTLSPVSPGGTLMVTSSPSGAMVSVDNGNTQMTPWTYRNVPVGVHLVSLFLSGYDPYVKNVEIIPGKTTEIHAPMTVRTGSGSLTVTSEPPGASIYVDGVYAGITNTVVGNIPPGRHQIRVSRAGYEDYEEWVVINVKEQAVINVVLSQPSVPKNGSVAITSEPPGASVFLNGAFSGITETGRPLEITELVPGSYHVYASMKNYQDIQEIVQVRPGEIASMAARLYPSPMPQDCGQLILTSDPAGAEISVDGTFRGKTPSTIDTVCSGSHTYTLTLPGYEEYSSSVQVTPGQVLQVNTVMNKKTGTETDTPWPAPAVLILVLAAVFIFLGRRS